MRSETGLEIAKAELNGTDELRGSEGKEGKEMAGENTARETIWAEEDRSRQSCHEKGSATLWKGSLEWAGDTGGKVCSEPIAVVAYMRPYIGNVSSMASDMPNRGVPINKKGMKNKIKNFWACHVPESLLFDLGMIRAHNL